MNISHLTFSLAQTKHRKSILKVLFVLKTLKDSKTFMLTFFDSSSCQPITILSFLFIHLLTHLMKQKREQRKLKINFFVEVNNIIKYSNMRTEVITYSVPSPDDPTLL